MFNKIQNSNQFQIRSQILIALVVTLTVVVVASCTLPEMTPMPASDADGAGMEDSGTDEGMADESSTGKATTEEAVASAEQPETDASPSSEVELLPAESPPFSQFEWSTDFTKRIVEWNEVMSGGPPKDGIPAIDEPEYESIADATEWLSESDPVILFQHEGNARAYPLAILMWHEIINDELAGKPVSVTFCPLCNASIVYDREFNGEILDFGTTGKLRNSDLIMYDRQSETWWQQFTGQGIVGEHTGQQLSWLASQVISFGDFAAEFPDGNMVARPSDVSRNYGRNPYVGYDAGQPFLFRGPTDDRLRATERIMGVELGDVTMAYDFATLAEAGVVNDSVADMSLVVLHKAGTSSALDSSSISDGRDIGSVAVFQRMVGDQELTFSANGDGTFADNETGSTWNILGQATDGELAGTQLEQVLAFDHFWFAWAAFFPDTGLYTQ